MKNPEQSHEITWLGEDGKTWKAEAGIESGLPCIRSILYKKNETWVLLAGPLYPQFEVTTGTRKADRLSHNYENRWNAYGDSPLSGDDVSTVAASFSATQCVVSKDGAVTTAEFDGLEMGYFKGGLRFIFYEGSNLIRVETSAVNNEHDSLAYIYRAGLGGFKPGMLYYGMLDRTFRRELPKGQSGNEKYVRVYARNRVLTMEQENGAVAVFPLLTNFFSPGSLRSIWGSISTGRKGKP
jgi:hypothetical protein